MTSRGVTIKAKIIFTMVLLPMISLLIVGAIALWQNRSSLASQAERHLQKLIHEKTTAYNHIFQRIQQEVEAAASFAEMIFHQPTPTAALNRRMLLPWTGQGYGNQEIELTHYEEILRLERVGQTLEAMVSKNPYLTLGYMATESAITVFDKQEVVSVIEQIAGFDPRARLWYTQAKEAQGSIWTELYVDANTKKLTVTAATPVYSPTGAVLGVVGFDVLLETLQNDILNIDIGYRNDPFMVNKQGQAIVRPKMDQENNTYQSDNLLKTKDDAFNRIVAKMVAGESGIELYRSQSGVQNYLAFAPIPTVGSSVGIVVQRSEIVRPVQESGKLVIIALAIIIFVSLGLGLMLGNQVSRPIEELTQQVDKVSRGLVEVEQIPIQRRDEIGILANSFNRMVANLGTVLRELEERKTSKA